MIFRKGSPTGKCFMCGRNTRIGNHETCGMKRIDDPKKQKRAASDARSAAKIYKNGRLPPWMLDT